MNSGPSSSFGSGMGVVRSCQMKYTTVHNTVGNVEKKKKMLQRTWMGTRIRV